MKSTYLSLAVLGILLSACGQSNQSAPQSKEADTEAHEEAPHDRVQLTEAQIQSAGIGIEHAGPADIRETLPLYGTVAPNAERVREVAARFPGVIRALSKSIGESVRQGEPLATVESNESLQTYSVVAPISGTVIARHANPGEQTEDKVLFTVADLSTVWVEIAIFPRDLAKVHVGQRVRVKAGDSGLQADGKVIYVAPFGTSTNQTLSARVLLDNAQGQWAPGLYVTAHLELSQSSVPVAVKSNALQTYEEQTVVFLKDGDSFVPQSVQTGRADQESVEIISGIVAGDLYAAANSFIIKADLGKGSAEHED